jgi:hypothetical protein
MNRFSDVFWEMLSGLGLDFIMSGAVHRNTAGDRSVKWEDLAGNGERERGGAATGRLWLVRICDIALVWGITLALPLVAH